MIAHDVVSCHQNLITTSRFNIQTRARHLVCSCMPRKSSDKRKCRTTKATSKTQGEHSGRRDEGEQANE